MGLADKITAPKKWRQRPEVLLCPNIPKPLSGVAPRVVLGQSWWDVTRFAAYASTDGHCVACGVFRAEARDSKHLEGHELYDLDLRKGRMTYVETVPLCRWCHSFIHDGRLLAMTNKGEVTRERYVAIMTHGKAVLLANLPPGKAAKLMRAWSGIEKPSFVVVPPTLPLWSKWRMVVEGKEYPPLYKSEAEWLEKFGA